MIFNWNDERSLGCDALSKLIDRHAKHIVGTNITANFQSKESNGEWMWHGQKTFSSILDQADAIDWSCKMEKKHSIYQY